MAIPSQFFVTLFEEWYPLAQQAKSEKAKSELLVSPILLEVRKLVNNSIELFSGEEFSVDKERDVTIDVNEYQVTPVERILGILKWMVEVDWV